MSFAITNTPVIAFDSIVHCDLDSFFASVEQALRPELVGKPVAVSAARGQGVITAATYEAKIAGIKVGMPYFKAQKILPSLTFIEARIEAYQRVGEYVKDIIIKTGAKIESLGVDECFIDLSTVIDEKINFSGGTPYQKAFSFASYIKDRVYTATGLNISIGVGSNKTIAKLASKDCKPNGLLIISKDNEFDFLSNKPLASITGIGPRTQQKLESVGFKYISDVLPLSQTTLRAILGKRQGDFIFHTSRNQLYNPVKPNPVAKTSSVMRSFPDPGVDAESTLLALHAELLDRLLASGRSVRYLSLFATNGYTTIADRIDLKAPIANPMQLSIALRKMISKVPKSFKSNFLGISFEGLSDSEQLPLDFPLADYNSSELYEPPEFITLTPSEYLKRNIFKGMSISHPIFGLGKVSQLEGNGFVAIFSNRSKILEFTAPVTITEVI
jgi:DNA polymerase-4